MLQSFFTKMHPIMLALCSILSYIYYAQNYAGIIDWSLIMALFHLEIYSYFTWSFALFITYKLIFFVT